MFSYECTTNYDIVRSILNKIVRLLSEIPPQHTRGVFVVDGQLALSVDHNKILLFVSRIELGVHVSREKDIQSLDEPKDQFDIDL